MAALDSLLDKPSRCIEKSRTHLRLQNWKKQGCRIRRGSTGKGLLSEQTGLLWTGCVPSRLTWWSPIPDVMVPGSQACGRGSDHEGGAPLMGLGPLQAEKPPAFFLSLCPPPCQVTRRRQLLANQEQSSHQTPHLPGPWSQNSQPLDCEQNVYIYLLCKPLRLWYSVIVARTRSLNGEASRRGQQLFYKVLDSK